MAQGGAVAPAGQNGVFRGLRWGERPWHPQEERRARRAAFHGETWVWLAAGRTLCGQAGAWTTPESPPSSCLTAAHISSGLHTRTPHFKVTAGRWALFLASTEAYGAQEALSRGWSPPALPGRLLVGSRRHSLSRQCREQPRVPSITPRSSRCRLVLFCFLRPETREAAHGLGAARHRQ